MSTWAQGLQQDGRGGPPPTAKTLAPVDFTGYWAAIVVEDWRYRMLPPQKYAVKPPLGTRLKIPMNAEAVKIALAWDPSKDEAAGEQCRGYGAPNVMRIPERIHITWQDDQTLKLETDAGQQTRLFEFGAVKSPGGGWQGVSAASWETFPGIRGEPLLSGSLKIVTTHLKPGYLQKNGIPYSANATLTEYFDRVDEPGASYIVVTTTVEDPTYLTQPYMTSTHFKKEADASGWKPSPCSAR
ncbi:MAG: hypothetical protein M3O20_00675 [Acidobacteriota bacterium]|nr:hypothetical protein [Acidobacteriota bacterium]